MKVIHEDHASTLFVESGNKLKFLSEIDDFKILKILENRFS